jgi:hypothetical protein
MLLRYTTSGQKIDVTIPIMMPYLYKHKNTVNRAINTVQNSIYVRRMGILTKYKPKLKPVICTLTEILKYGKLWREKYQHQNLLVIVVLPLVIQYNWDPKTTPVLLILLAVIQYNFIFQMIAVERV